MAKRKDRQLLPVQLLQQYTRENAGRREKVAGCGEDISCIPAAFMCVFVPLFFVKISSA